MVYLRISYGNNFKFAPKTLQNVAKFNKKRGRKTNICF